MEHLKECIRKFIIDAKILYSRLRRLSIPIVQGYLVNIDIVLCIIAGMMKGDLRIIPLGKGIEIE